MRVGYFVMGVGLAVTKWPELSRHDPWELKQGTVVTILVAMSVLALLGLRYPQRMLPILLFEVGWKLTLARASSRCRCGWTATSPGPHANRPVRSCGWSPSSRSSPGVTWSASSY